MREYDSQDDMGFAQAQNNIDEYWRKQLTSSGFSIAEGDEVRFDPFFGLRIQSYLQPKNSEFLDLTPEDQKLLKGMLIKP